MGKAKKSKTGKRFNPLARGDAMAVDDGVAEPPKQLSAHQQRYMERKALKAEAEALKAQRRKVSKSNKFECKKQKKALSNSIRDSIQRANDKTLVLPRGAPPQPAPAPAAVMPANFSFSLPTPTSGAKSMLSDAPRLGAA